MVKEVPPLLSFILQGASKVTCCSSCFIHPLIESQLQLGFELISPIVVTDRIPSILPLTIILESFINQLHKSFTNGLIVLTRKFNEFEEVSAQMCQTFLLGGNSVAVVNTIIITAEYSAILSPQLVFQFCTGAGIGSLK